MGLQPPVLQRVKQQLQLVGKAFLVGACLETTAPLPLQCPPPQPAGMVYLAGDFLGMNVILPCLPHQPLLTPQLLVEVAFLDGVSLAMDVNPKPLQPLQQQQQQQQQNVGVLLVGVYWVAKDLIQSHTG